jgi:outer membrane receptor for Fe3+-dicitrate
MVMGRRQFLRSCRPALPKCSCPALSFAAAFGHSATAQESIALPTIEVSAEQTSSGKQPATAPTLADLPVGASSELNVTGQTLNQRAYDRPAEVLEVVPGLIISQHSGKGKANQYFLRGYNLDHGTDLAIWVDGMPCNMRTHAHGQRLL